MKELIDYKFEYTIFIHSTMSIMVIMSNSIINVVYIVNPTVLSDEEHSMLLSLDGGFYSEYPSVFQRLEDLSLLHDSNCVELGTGWVNVGQISTLVRFQLDSSGAFN